MGRPTRVLLLSYAYEPGIGGIEGVGLLVADGLRERGYEVRVVTAESGGPVDSNGITVLRRPGVRALIRAIRWADVVLQSHVSLQLSWPLAFRLLSRPWVVVNHTSLTLPGARSRPQDRLKRWGLPRGATFAVSRFLAEEIPGTSGVVPNPYDQSVFLTPGEADGRAGEILFVGRLVTAKGADVLIDAVAELERSGAPTRLTVIGDGPERDALERQARRLGVDGRIVFAGPAELSEVGRRMREHRVLAVPSRSRPPEAFGVVAIEGLASGCVVVATDQGGLPEAVGPGGLLVPEDDAHALAAALRRALDDEALGATLRQEGRLHIREFTRQHVVDRYVEELERVRLAARRGRRRRK